MRRILGAIVAGGLWLGLAAGAEAQDSMNAFGAYPTQTGTGLPYTLYAPRTNEATAANYAYGPNAYYGSPVSPGITTYNSGYSGTYAPVYSYPYTYTYPTTGYSTYSYPAAGYSTYNYYPAYRYRRGLFGLRNR